MSLEEPYWTMYPTFSTSLIQGAIDLVVSGHIMKALATPVCHMLSLIDVGYILHDCGFSKHVESLEDTLIGEVQLTIAVSTVFLDSLHLGVFLHNVPLFMAIVAEVIAASASKERALDWASSLRSQWHLVFSGHGHWGIGDMSITYLL